MLQVELLNWFHFNSKWIFACFVQACVLHRSSEYNTRFSLKASARTHSNSLIRKKQAAWM